jgi:hypothetical protein
VESFKTWKGHFWCLNVKDALKMLRDVRHRRASEVLARPTKISQLTLRHRKGRVVVHQAPERVRALRALLRRLLEATTGYDVFVPRRRHRDRSVTEPSQELLVTKRLDAPRDAIFAEQHGRCALCGREAKELRDRPRPAR